MEKLIQRLVGVLEAATTGPKEILEDKLTSKKFLGYESDGDSIEKEGKIDDDLLIPKTSQLRVQRMLKI